MKKYSDKNTISKRDSAQIDPISRRIKGYSYREFEDDHWHSIIDFSIFSQRNLTFIHSMDVKMDLEVIGRKL